jgi:DNA polymerase III subunit beta
VKLTASRIDLIKAIGAAVRVVERRNTIPVLGNVLLRAEGGQLAIRATDLDIEISTRCAATITDPGATTVPAATFHDLLRKLPEGAEVSLETGSSSPKGDSRNDASSSAQRDSHTQITIRSGRSRFVLQTLPEGDFPDIAAGEMSHSFALPAENLASMIGQVGFAVSTEETRYYLNGIYLHTVQAESATLIAVATDGHRLARRTHPCPAGAEGMPGIIVPRKAVGEIARLIEKLGSQLVEISLSTTKLRIETPDATFLTKLIDGTFPDYARVIPQGNDKHAVLDAAELVAAVDRVATISSERGRAVKLNFAESSLAIEVTNPDAGTARDEVEADYTDEPLEIGFNARYLADILGVLIASGTGSVTMQLGSPGSPTILQASKAADLLIVLMPMRV